MKQVSIRPPWEFLRSNRIFESPEVFGCQQPFAAWKAQAAVQGFALNTDDILPPSQADCVWLMDLPKRKQTFDDLLGSLRSGTKVVLQIIESPVFKPASFDVRNHARCDLILSYDYSMRPDSRYRHYRLPSGLGLQSSEIHFSERRCAIMLNTNKISGWMETWQPGTGLMKLPGIGHHFGGWKLPWRSLVLPGDGELYSWRRKLARAAERVEQPVLDIYGNGWRGERVSWFPWAVPRPYRRALEAPRVENPRWKNYNAKYSLMNGYRFGIAVENYRGRRGYISEKMIDVFLAGAVPVYLGEESIEEVIPSAAFVDVRCFSGPKALLSYLMNCSEREWVDMRQAGQAWLTSFAGAQFGAPAYAEIATAALRDVLG